MVVRGDTHRRDDYNDITMKGNSPLSPPNFLHAPRDNELIPETLARAEQMAQIVISNLTSTPMLVTPAACAAQDFLDFLLSYRTELPNFSAALLEEPEAISRGQSMVPSVMTPISVKHSAILRRVGSQRNQSAKTRPPSDTLSPLTPSRSYSGTRHNESRWSESTTEKSPKLRGEFEYNEDNDDDTMVTETSYLQNFKFGQNDDPEGSPVASEAGTSPCIHDRRQSQLLEDIPQELCSSQESHQLTTAPVSTPTTKYVKLPEGEQPLSPSEKRTRRVSVIDIRKEPRRTESVRGSIMRRGSLQNTARRASIVEPPPHYRRASISAPPGNRRGSFSQGRRASFATAANQSPHHTYQQAITVSRCPSMISASTRPSNLGGGMARSMSGYRVSPTPSSLFPNYLAARRESTAPDLNLLLPVRQQSSGSLGSPELSHQDDPRPLRASCVSPNNYSFPSLANTNRHMSVSTMWKMRRTSSKFSKNLNMSEIFDEGDELERLHRMEDFRGQQLVTDEQVKASKYIERFNSFDRIWVAVVFMAILLQTLGTTFVIGFGVPPSKSVIVAATVVDLLLWAEVALTCFRPVERDGLVDTNGATIRRHYIKGQATHKRVLALDVAALFPLQFLGLALSEQPVGSYFGRYHGFTGDISPLWYINRLLLTRYTVRYFTTLFQGIFSHHPIVARISSSLFFFLYVAHFVACGWVSLQFYEGPVRSTKWTQAEHVFSSPMFLQYLLGYDYAIKAMSGMSRGSPVPHTDLQTVFALVVAMLGVAMYATVIATIGGLVNDTGSELSNLKERLDKIHDFLHYTKMPMSLYSEIRSYYLYLYETSNKTGLVGSVLSDLPLKLRYRVDELVGVQALRHVPIFSRALEDTHFLTFLLACLEVKTFCKGEAIFTRGEWGDCMYLITSGLVEVEEPQTNRVKGRTMSAVLDNHAMDRLQKQTSVVVSTYLGPGDFVGEIALLHVCRRPTTAVALQHTSVFVLYREAFLQAELKYPWALSLVREQAEDKLSALRNADEHRRDIIKLLLIYTDYGITQYYYNKLHDHASLRIFKRQQEVRRSTNVTKLRALRQAMSTGGVDPTAPWLSAGETVITQGGLLSTSTMCSTGSAPGSRRDTQLEGKVSFQSTIPCLSSNNLGVFGANMGITHAASEIIAPDDAIPVDYDDIFRSRVRDD